MSEKDSSVLSGRDGPDSELEALLAKARTIVMSPEDIAAQRESYVRGELGMGSDADEAEYRRRMDAGEPLFDTPSGAPPSPLAAPAEGEWLPKTAAPQVQDGAMKAAVGDVLTADEVMAEIDPYASPAVRDVLRLSYQGVHRPADKGKIADVVLRDLALEPVTVFRRTTARDQTPAHLRHVAKGKPSPIAAPAVRSAEREVVIPSNSRMERMKEALREIAKQELSADMSVDDQLGGDFEGAYNHMIMLARRILDEEKAGG